MTSAPVMHRRTFVTGLIVGLTAAIAAPAALAQFTINPNISPNIDLQLLSQDRIVNIQQGNGLRFVDAWDDGTHDWTAVTRSFENNGSQQWRMTEVGSGVYTFQQVSSGRFLDAHETGAPGYDYRMVLRPQQNNASQQWRLVDYGGAFYTMENVLLARLADNSLDPALDFQLMTRMPNEAQGNSQVWRIVDAD